MCRDGPGVKTKASSTSFTVCGHECHRNLRSGIRPVPDSSPRPTLPRRRLSQVTRPQLSQLPHHDVGRCRRPPYTVTANPGGAARDHAACRSALPGHRALQQCALMRSCRRRQRWWNVEYLRWLGFCSGTVARAIHHVRRCADCRWLYGLRIRDFLASGLGWSSSSVTPGNIVVATPAVTVTMSTNTLRAGNHQDSIWFCGWRRLDRYDVTHGGSIPSVGQSDQR